MTDNFESTLASDGARVQRSATGSIDAIILPSGKALPWRNPGGASDRETSLAAQLVRIAVRADAKIVQINADGRLSPTAKIEDAAKATTAAHAEFEAARVDADRLIAAFAAQDVLGATAPALQAGDHVGSDVDRELRDRAHAMDPSAQAALAQQLLDGKHGRMLAALLREPYLLPDVLARVVPAAWVNAQALANPTEARQRRAAVERINFLHNRMAQAATALPARSQAQRQAATVAAEIARRSAA